MSKKVAGPLTRGPEKRPEAGPKIRRPTTLWVTVRRAERRAAERIAREHAGQPLETVLAAFVAELAKADALPGEWSQNLVAVWLLTHAWPQTATNDLP